MSSYTPVMSMRLTACVAALAVVASSASAWAEESNYQPFPLGERALGMGGAFTAMSGDPIATYYNPAALVPGRSNALSASLNVYGIVSRTIESGGFYLAFEQDTENPEILRPRLVDLEFREFPPATIPLSSVLVRRLGRRMADRQRPLAVAWSVMVPRASDLQYSIVAHNDYDHDPSTINDEHRITFREEEKLRFVGPSIAYRLTPRFSLGLSAFIAIWNFSHSYHHTFFNMAPSDEGGGIQVRELEISSTVYSGVFRLGAFWLLGERWRLGLMVSLPSFEIQGEGSYSIRDLQTFSGSFELDERRDALPHNLQPLEVRAGLSYEIPNSWAAALDVTFYAPASYDRFEEPPGWTGIYWVHRVERGAIANVNLGGEVIIRERWPLRMGFFTNFSSAPEIVPSNEPALPRIHIVGGTISLGYTSGGFDINIGVMGSFGRGEAQTVGPQGPDLPTYVPTQAEDMRLYFFISGASRAAERLVGNVIDRIENRNEQPSPQQTSRQTGN